MTIEDDIKEIKDIIYEQSAKIQNQNSAILEGIKLILENQTKKSVKLEYTKYDEYIWEIN